MANGSRRGRRRVRHAVSVLAEAGAFLERNPSANDVAVVCLDGEFRMSSLVLSAASPLLRESLLESRCTCVDTLGCLDDFWGWSGDSVAFPNAVVVVDPEFELSVEDLADFFSLLFGAKKASEVRLDALTKTCLALQIKKKYLPAVIFEQQACNELPSPPRGRTLRSQSRKASSSASSGGGHNPHLSSEGYGSGMLSSPSAASCSSNRPSVSDVSHEVTVGNEQEEEEEDEVQAPVYECEFCPESFHSRSGHESHLQSRHGVSRVVISKKGSGLMSDDDEEMEEGEDGQQPQTDPQTKEGEGDKSKYAYATLDGEGRVGALVNFPVRTDVRPTTVQCHYCRQKFSGCQTLRTHIRAEHPDSSLNCLMCGEECDSEKALFDHIQTHSDDPDNVFFPCKYCRMNFSVRYDLRMHIRRAHAPQPPSFRCQQCGAAFFNAKVLATHIAETHGGRITTRFHMCPHCDKRFKYYGQLERHLRSHLGARNHICEACGRSFMEERALRAHRRAAHLNPGRRRMEIKLAGGAGIIAEEGGVDFVNSRKVYGCELCDKVFRLRGYLMRHLRSEEHREREARKAVQDIIRSVRRKQQKQLRDGDGDDHHQIHRQQQEIEDEMEEEVETATAVEMLVREEVVVGDSFVCGVDGDLYETEEEERPTASPTPGDDDDDVDDVDDLVRLGEEHDGHRLGLDLVEGQVDNHE